MAWIVGALVYAGLVVLAIVAGKAMKGGREASSTPQEIYRWDNEIPDERKLTLEEKRVATDQYVERTGEYWRP